jgi:hypothetical protein
MGAIAAKVISVRVTEMNMQMINVATITMRDLKNIEMLVLNPSWMTPVSELNLLRISPVFVSSKKPMSLLISYTTKSYLSIWAIRSERLLKVNALTQTKRPETTQMMAISMQ